VQAGFVREYCVWIHVDFLSFGNVDLQALEDELRRFTFRRIREILQTEYAEYCPKTGAEIRGLFRAQIAEAQLTALHNVPEGSPAWEDRVNALVHSLYSDDAAFSGAVLTAAARRGRRVVFVLDNTDQLGERFQESVFLLSQRLAKECNALTIVSLREEKFFAAYRRGLFDAYGDRRFHIGSPSLEDWKTLSGDVLPTRSSGIAQPDRTACLMSQSQRGARSRRFCRRSSIRLRGAIEIL
jgi:hypothetical protein